MKIKFLYRVIILSALLGSSVSVFADDDGDQVYGDSSSMSTTQRLSVLERQVKNINSQNSSSKLQDLQAQNDQLRGRIDELEHQVNQLTDQLKQQYQDLNQRVTTLSTVKPAATKVDNAVSADDIKHGKDLEANEKALDKGVVATKPVDSKQEKAAYDAALAKLKKRDYPAAIKSFENFVAKFPNGNYTPNGYFWLGEIHLLQNQPDAALEAYKHVINDFPDSDKVPMAQTKIGFAYRDQGSADKARAQFNKVIKGYKDTPAAKLAADQLKTLGANKKAAPNNSANKKGNASTDSQ